MPFYQLTLSTLETKVGLACSTQWGVHWTNAPEKHSGERCETWNKSPMGLLTKTNPFPSMHQSSTVLFGYLILSTKHRAKFEDKTPHPPPVTLPQAIKKGGNIYSMMHSTHLIYGYMDRRKEMFILWHTQHILFMVIWCQTYSKG